jgi:hypothetical protein
VLFFAATACGGQSIDAGYQDENPTRPLDRRSIDAKCGGAPGPTKEVTSFDELYATLEGTWFRCGTSETAPDAIELGRDGAWFALRNDGTGRFVRGSSSSDQGVLLDVAKNLSARYPTTYSIKLRPADDAVFLTFHLQPTRMTWSVQDEARIRAPIATFVR